MKNLNELQNELKETRKEMSELKETMRYLTWQGSEMKEADKKFDKLYFKKENLENEIKKLRRADGEKFLEHLGWWPESTLLERLEENPELEFIIDECRYEGCLDVSKYC